MYRIISEFASKKKLSFGYGLKDNEEKKNIYLKIDTRPVVGRMSGEVLFSDQGVAVREELSTYLRRRGYIVDISDDKLIVVYRLQVPGGASGILKKDFKRVNYVAEFKNEVYYFENVDVFLAKTYDSATNTVLINGKFFVQGQLTMADINSLKFHYKDDSVELTPSKLNVTMGRIPSVFQHRACTPETYNANDIYLIDIVSLFNNHKLADFNFEIESDTETGAMFGVIGENNPTLLVDFGGGNIYNILPDGLVLPTSTPYTPYKFIKC